MEALNTLGPDWKVRGRGSKWEGVEQAGVSSEVETAIDSCARRLREIDAALEKWKVLVWWLACCVVCSVSVCCAGY